MARAVEEQQRVTALAASVLAFITLGGLSTTYYLQQRAKQERQQIEQRAERVMQQIEREAASDRVVSRADTLLKEAKHNPEDLTRWQVALAAVKQAEAAGDQGAAPRLLALATQIQAGLDAAQRDKTLLDRVVAIRAAEADDPDGLITDHDYAEAFRRRHRFRRPECGRGGGQDQGSPAVGGTGPGHGDRRLGGHLQHETRDPAQLAGID